MASTVYPFPPPGIATPAIVIGYPEVIDLQTTFGRGSDTLEIPVWFVVADQGVTAQARDALSAVLGAGQTIAGVLSSVSAWGTSNCGGARIEPLKVGGIDYLAVKFDVECSTSGPVNLSAVMDGLAALCTAAGL